MTNPEQARMYLAEHLMEVAGRPVAVSNPKDRPVEDLPAMRTKVMTLEERWKRRVERSLDEKLRVRAALKRRIYSLDAEIDEIRGVLATVEKEDR